MNDLRSKKAFHLPLMGKTRLMLCLLCVSCVCLPFVLVEVPPILDLAQQTAQIRLFEESVFDADSPYQIQWFTPNKLSYGVLGLSWLCAGPANAGRLAMIFLALLWVVSCFWLAARRNRPVSMAVLGSVFFFNHFVYLGFLSFTVGFPVFVVWFILMSDPPTPSQGTRKLFLVALGGSVLLYAAHALWLAAGAAWMVLHSLLHRHPRKTILIRILGMLPLVFLTGIQYIAVAQAYWGNKIAFSIPTGKQLFSSFYLNYAFGGVRGWLEPLTAAILLVWVVLAVWQYRKELRSAADGPLLMAAIFFITIGLLLPSMVGRTLFFGSRWVPVGCALFLIAMPTIRIRDFLKTVLAVAVVMLFCVATTKIWIDFEDHEMAGFPEAMSQIPPGSHLIALDFQRVSPRIKMPPYFQMYAYAQVLNGADLNWSFAGSPTSLVVYKDKHKPWTEKLDWHPERVQQSDFAYFDYTLFHSSSVIQARWSEAAGLEPVTEPGDWRLFRITDEKAMTP